MDPISWKRIEDVFLGAVERTGVDRERFLETACNGDGNLRSEVESLLRAEREPEVTMTSLVRGSVASMVKEEFENLRAGEWRLVEEIGRGGMGTVYRAVRHNDDFEIEAAVKILNRGFNSPALMDRFRRERQMLARLEHPNVARLLDGGTTAAGLPYIVMEYVAGEPITRYCDNRRLSVRERIALFLRVCEAVSCAHRNLIVHRDIKPDNILVTADGVPKLLDFGIGKILDPTGEGDDLTSTAERMGTPSWCSPEQIRGDHIGVGTDVYSLGVVLCRLLTGYRPYASDSVTWENAQSLICDRDALRASEAASTKPKTPDEARQVAYLRSTSAEGLRRQLVGDIDNILALTLRKEPDRRYLSVDQLSDELQRYLDGRPVRAAGDTVFYLAGKFIRRHRLGVGAAAVLTLLLCISTIAAVWQARRLTIRLGEDQKLAGSFLSDIHNDIARLPGSTPAREALLRKSVDYLNGLARDSGENLETRRSLAVAEEQFAELLNTTGQSGRALEAWLNAKAIREAILAENRSDRKAQYELVSSYLTGGFIAGRARSAEEMQRYNNRALSMAESLNAADPADKSYQVLLAQAQTAAAYGLGVMGRRDEAIQLLRKAVEIREKIVSVSPGDTEAQRQLATVHYRIGSTEAQYGKPDAALRDLGNALRIQNALRAANPNDSQVRFDLASIHHFTGVSLGAMGRNQDALAEFQEAIGLREAALAADPRDGTTRTLLAGNYAERSVVERNMGRQTEAVASMQRAIEIQRQSLAANPKGVPVRISLATYEGRLAGYYTGQRQYRDANQSWSRAVAIYDQLDKEGLIQVPDVRHDAQVAHAQLEETARLSQ